VVAVARNLAMILHAIWRDGSDFRFGQASTADSDVSCLPHRREAVRARGGTSMDLYAGLDVSLNETSRCIIDSDGKILRESKVPSEPEAIRSAFEGYADRLGRLAIEASSLGICFIASSPPLSCRRL
jgi:hypothetical protein